MLSSRSDPSPLDPQKRPSLGQVTNWKGNAFRNRLLCQIPAKGRARPAIAEEGCAAERRVGAQEVEVGGGPRRAPGQEGGDQRRPGRGFGFSGV